jgi:hypothetical protein
MLLSRSLVLIVALMIFLAPCFAGDSGGGDKVFTISVAGPTLPKDVQIRYFLGGEFGGFFASTTATGEESKIIIRTERENKAATTFRAIAYAPGCQFVTISVDDLSATNREAEFQCQRLSTTLLQGRVPASVINGKDLQVQVLYVCNWAGKALGLGNLAVSPLAVAKVHVDTDGTFAIDLPDFAADPLWSSMADDAGLTFQLIDAATGAQLNTLLPPKDISSGISLKVASSYPNEVQFTLQPEGPVQH